jgi:large subunit ribosomal protein L18
MNTKLEQRQKIRYRIRKKISGEATKPRLSVFRSNTDIYVQLIDDVNGKTLAAASLKQKTLLPKSNQNRKKQAGWCSDCTKATELGITTVVFDRGGNLYHGRVKAVQMAPVKVA